MIGATLDGGSDPTCDLIQPFQLELSNVRGRAVRLETVLAEILGRHAYPPQVEQVLAESIVVTVLLASLLKYDGVFTLQTRGDGPVSLIVTDVTTAGDVRAYARFDADRLPPVGANGPIGDLLGEGYLAFTVDQGQDTDRYQGIVALTGLRLADCLAHYFAQSEQLPTAVKLVARKIGDSWRAGGILLQRLPDDDAGRLLKSPGDDAEDWNRATILMGSAAEVELLDRSLHLNNLLFRLFHEERVRVFSPTAITQGCRCSEARVRRVLRSLSPEELEELKLDGSVSVKCEFCSESYRFDAPEIERLRVEEPGRP